MLRHPDKMRAASRLLHEEGKVHAARGDGLTAALRYRKALDLLLEARALGPSEEDDAALLELSRLVP
jgi:hypothetical protein